MKPGFAPAEPDVVIVDLLSAAASGGGHPLFSLVRAREKAGKATVLVASQPHAEASQAQALEVPYLEKLGAQVVQFQAAARVLQKPGAAGSRK